jgi:ribosomal protein S18 acetylase RimI-like enzyme
MEANLAAHLAHLPSHLHGALLLDDPALLLIDSGFPSDTFNAICRARLAGKDIDTRIDRAIEHFRHKNLPFSWWVGPASEPADLGKRLAAHSLTCAEAEAAMALDLAAVPAPPPPPGGLTIRQVNTEAEFMTYAAVVAANWDPPDQSVLAVYSGAAAPTLSPGSPARYLIGYLEGEPVAASECFLAHSVAGIYNVVTLPHARRQGIGTALTAAALATAREEGYRTAVLQASANGQGIYARLGFAVRGEFREYKPV